jgi:ATP-dependent protease ClpP protease subunit
VKTSRVEILLYGLIESKLVDAVMAKLAAAPDAKELVVRIHSPGGSVADGVALYNALKRHPGRKVVHVDGVAASMASYIMLAADRIVIAANARVMVHEPRLDALDSTVEDLEGGVERLRAVRQIMLDGYAARTRKSAETVAAWLAKETWFTAAEALAAGLVDEVEREQRMAALADDAVALLERFKNTPDTLRAAARAKEKTMSDPVAVSKTILAHLALAETATEADAVVAVSRMSENVKAFIALTGKEDVQEALGVVRGWQEAAKANQAVADELAKLRGEAQARAVDDLVASAKREGRLPPAAEKSARELGAQNVGALKAFLEVLPKVGGERAEAAVRAGVVDAGDIDLESVTLTAEEERMAKQMGGSSSKGVSDAKAAMLARKKERLAALATHDAA